MIELMKIMTYLLSFSALLVAFAAGVRGQSCLSNVTESRDSAFANYTGTVFDADGDFELNWSVNFTTVVFTMFTANSSRSIANRTADAIVVTDRSSYSFSFDLSGANITSKLSIRNPNGSYTVTLTVPGFSATFYPDTNDARMLGITNATEMGSSTEAMTTMTSTMVTQTDQATITTSTQTPTQTNEQLPTIPDNARITRISWWIILVISIAVILFFSVVGTFLVFYIYKRKMKTYNLTKTRPFELASAYSRDRIDNRMRPNFTLLASQNRLAQPTLRATDDANKSWIFCYFDDERRCESIYRLRTSK